MGAWPNNPVIYEINALAWLNGLGRRLARPVTLASVPAAEWDALSALGFDAVWLMGVWERSPRGIEDQCAARLVEGALAARARFARRRAGAGPVVMGNR